MTIQFSTAVRNARREEPPPHGNIGLSTAYRISDAAPPPRVPGKKRAALIRGDAIAPRVRLS